MRTVLALCRKLTYQSSESGAEVSFLVPYEATIYWCAFCREQFFAREEDGLYRDLKSTIQGKVCPTCDTPLPQCLVNREIPLLNRDRDSFDAEMGAKGYDHLSITEDVYADLYDLFT